MIDNQLKLARVVIINAFKYLYLMLNRAYVNSLKCLNSSELVEAAESMRVGDFQSATESYEEGDRVTGIGKYGDWWMSFESLKNSLPKDSKVLNKLTG